MSGDIQRRIAEDAARSKELRDKVAAALKKAGEPPVEAQVAFLKGLMDNKGEADRFMKNPKGYCLEHGVVISPEVVQMVVHNVINDQGVDPGLLRRYGDKVVGQVLDMRSPGGGKAWVVAAAAVVVAVAAVVTMVVTLVRSSRPMDARVLVGLGPDGIRLPGGAQFDIKSSKLRGGGPM